MPSGGLTGELRPPRRLETAKARGCTTGTTGRLPTHIQTTGGREKTDEDEDEDEDRDDDKTSPPESDG